MEMAMLIEAYEDEIAAAAPEVGRAELMTDLRHIEERLNRFAEDLASTADRVRKTIHTLSR